MQTPDLTSLLQPVTAESPCGYDLEYDAEFQTLQLDAVGRPEQVYGSIVVSPATTPDWGSVYRRALSLLQRSKDLRTAVLYWRAALRCGDFAARCHGFVLGLQLVDALCCDYWDSVHPVPDLDDGDVTARLNALAPFTDSHVLPELAELAIDFEMPEGNDTLSIVNAIVKATAVRLAASGDDMGALRDGIREAYKAASNIDDLLQQHTHGESLGAGLLRKCIRAWSESAQGQGVTAAWTPAIGGELSIDLGAAPLAGASASRRAEAEVLLTRMLAFLESHHADAGVDDSESPR